MKRISWGRKLGISAAMVIIVACGGGGNEVASTPESPIGGTINTENFVIAAGETRVATSDLTIHATKSIKIDGTLKVPDNLSFSLQSDGSVIINGKIISSAVAAAPSRGNPGDGSIDGDNVILNGQISLPAGRGFNLSGTGPNATLVINGTILGGDGKASTLKTAPGDNGGGIDIGTPAAIAYAASLGRVNNLPFKTVTVGAGAVLRGGKGGSGYSDQSGQPVGADIVATCTAGGNGGLVAIKSSGALQMAGTLQGGDGGIGGSSLLVKGKDGDAPGVAGQNVVVTTGNGGDGGSVTLSGAPLTATGKKLRGLGNYGGSARLTSGDGGEHANGGNGTVNVGRKGKDGTGDPRATTLDKPSVSFSSGGQGGDGVSNGTNGGNGGKFAIRQVGGGAPELSAVAALAAGLGGFGSDACIEYPFGAGGKGGDAFAIDTGGSPVVPNYTASCKGGRGGDGDPVGKGGSGPQGNGEDGKPCAAVELVVQLDFDLGITFDEDDIIPVAAFTGAHVSGPEYPISEEHGCRFYHLHADSQIVPATYITVNGVKYGPFADPNHAHCGFGRVFTRIKSSRPDTRHAESLKGSCCGE